MHLATEDQLHELTLMLLAFGAERLSEHRFECFGLAVQLDGTLARIQVHEHDVTLDHLGDACRRLVPQALAFGLFAMVEAAEVPDHCLFTMAVEGNNGLCFCCFGVLGPEDGKYEVQESCQVRVTPSFFNQQRH